MYLKFVCPMCNGEPLLEVVQTDGIMATPIAVYSDEIVWKHDQIEVSDAVTGRIQCSNCGWVVPLVDPDDEDELISWLAQQGYNRVQTPKE